MNKKYTIVVVLFSAIACLSLLSSCASSYLVGEIKTSEATKENEKAKEEKKAKEADILDAVCKNIDELFGETGKSETYFQKASDGQYRMDYPYKVSIVYNSIVLETGGFPIDFKLSMGFSGGKIDASSVYFYLDVDDSSPRSYAGYKSPGFDSKPRYVLFVTETLSKDDNLLLDLDDVLSAYKFLEYVQRATACFRRIEFYDKNGRRLRYYYSGTGGDDDCSVFLDLAAVSSLIELYDKFLWESLSEEEKATVRNTEAHVSSEGLVYDYLQRVIRTEEKPTGFSLDLVSNGLRYKYEPYISGAIYGLKSEPAYLMFWSEEMTDVYIVPVDNSGSVAVDEGLIRYIGEIPSGRVRWDFYDRSGYRIKRNERYYSLSHGVMFLSSYDSDVSGYADVTKVKNLISMYLGLKDDTMKSNTYAEGTGEFYLDTSSHLVLGYETRSANPMGFRLRGDPKYIVLRSEKSDRSIILSLEDNSGKYPVDSKLMKFICSCDDGDTIRIEYYNDYKNRMYFYQLALDSNGKPTTKTSEKWYETIDVTTSKNLIRQWQPLGEYDYLANWDVDKESAVNWILGI